MGRKIAVIIDIDEEKAEKLMPGAAPGEYIEKEFGRLEKRGISLDEWLITDHDDECEWARHINYLINWAFENSYSENEDISPLKFAEWKNKLRYA